MIVITPKRKLHNSYFLSFSYRVVWFWWMQSLIMFLSSNLERLLHIHNQVENCLEVCLMEDRRKKGHLIKTHLKDFHLIHMLDFMDGRFLIQRYSCNHGINWFQFNMPQPINYHIKSFNMPHM